MFPKRVLTKLRFGFFVLVWVFLVVGCFGFFFLLAFTGDSNGLLA